MALFTLLHDTISIKDQTGIQKMPSEHIYGVLSFLLDLGAVTPMPLSTLGCLGGDVLTFLFNVAVSTGCLIYSALETEFNMDFN